jgi:hypothetical protein
MKILDKETLDKAIKFLGTESIFCIIKGIVKKPITDVNADGEKFYRFNLRSTNKEGYSQTFTCIIPAKQAADFKEKDFLVFKNMEVIIIPSFSNQINEWKNEETGKTLVNNRLTIYVSRLGVIGEGETNKTFDDELGVNW